MTVYRTIQIRNSITSNATTNTLPTLLPGELAFTQSGNSLFIGAPDGTSGNIRIAHQIVSNGTVVPGEPLVANSIGGNNHLTIANLDSIIINTDIINTNTLNVSNVSFNYATINNISSNSIVANIVNTHVINTSNLSVDLLNANGSYGTAGYVLTSAGISGNTYWALPQGTSYYITTQMYDYSTLGLGWMNLAPNQDPNTLGFIANAATIPFGSIWILAVNDGSVDPQPITIYSLNTRTTPMMWMSIDGSGPYDPDTNPNGQAYWFNITPPPSGG